MKKAQSEMRHWMATEDVTGYALSQSLGRNRNYIARFLYRDWDQPGVVLSIARTGLSSAIYDEGAPPLFSGDVLDEAQRLVDEEVAARVMARRHHNLAGCVRDMEESPCDTCPMRATCAELTEVDGRLLGKSCEAFYVYTMPRDSRIAWEDAARQPTQDWYKRTFPEHDEDQEQIVGSQDPSTAGEIPEVCPEGYNSKNGSRVSLGSAETDEQAERLPVGSSIPNTF